MQEWFQVTAGQATNRQGKADYRLFRSISRLTGSARRDVLLGPMFGSDVGVINIGGGRVMAISTDPIYINQFMALEDASWFAFHVLVSDVALSGLAPSHLALSWNLPPELDDSTFVSMSRSFHNEAKALGISVVTGHTGRYDGCATPVIGAGTSMAVGRRERLVLPSGMRNGDRLIMTKSPAMETAILLACEFRQGLIRHLGEDAVRGLQSRLHMLSPVADAVVASGVHGISAMHDASERGIYGALHELSRASGLSFTIVSRDIVIEPVVKQIADLFGFDPLESSSEGTLLITAEEESAAKVVRKLSRAGITSCICGTVTKSRNRVSEIAPDGRLRVVDEPLTDGYLVAKTSRMGRLLRQGPA